MPWRPIFMVSLLLVSFIANGAMLWYERIDPPDEVVELKDDIRAVSFILMPHKRRENFGKMGLGRLVDAAVGEAARLDKSEARIRAVIQESADEVSNAMCTGGRLPPRFAALPLVVEQDGTGRRRVIDGSTATAFFTQDWFETSLTDQVYSTLELRENRPENAPAVGVAAVLANAELQAINEEGPFDPGFTGVDLDDVLEEYPWVEKELVRYFALMHVVGELARSDKGGVCG
ncbi:MAG: hypothetical protein EP330_04285 [Deltaproteobacteria bacterium]|nr:MAG: hypothetical protein EP330_04285 [Deltaproteobacteria bacterium]